MIKVDSVTGEIVIDGEYGVDEVIEILQKLQFGRTLLKVSMSVNPVRRSRKNLDLWVQDVTYAEYFWTQVRGVKYFLTQ